MSFRYGQRHVIELEKAKEVAQQLGATRHIIVDVDLRVFGGSALTSDIAVPKGRAAADIAHGIPSTYVPARNTIFLSFALAWAEVVGSGDIFVGVNALDYSGYPDFRPPNTSKRSSGWLTWRRKPEWKADTSSRSTRLSSRSARQASS